MMWGLAVVGMDGCGYAHIYGDVLVLIEISTEYYSVLV